MQSIHQYVHQEVQKALPKAWRQIAPEKLLGRGKCKISHAFGSQNRHGQHKLINVLVLELEKTYDKQWDLDVIKLRDYILSKDCLLVIVVEQEGSKHLDDLGQFVSETLCPPHKNCVALYCCRDKGFKTTIDGTYEDLSQVIHDIWKGKLTFKGISEGKQLANLEIMDDECEECGSYMISVTGIVFPNIQLESWDNDEWQYFNQLYPLYKLSSRHSDYIQKLVHGLRITEDYISELQYISNYTGKSKYLASICPDCNSPRDKFSVLDYRTNYLHDLSSRYDGSLNYFPIEIIVDRKMISNLQDVFTGCRHTCIMGWDRENY